MDSTYLIDLLSFGGLKDVFLTVWIIRIHKGADEKERPDKKFNQAGYRTGERCPTQQYKALRNKVTGQIRKENVDYNNNRLKKQTMKKYSGEWPMTS